MVMVGWYFCGLSLRCTALRTLWVLVIDGFFEMEGYR